ncbi:MAG: hypothetical protein RBT34_13375 [Anaerolineaceae bacterium]|nr:hypothetical protein [Anaerolineaceae bacterium]
MNIKWNKVASALALIIGAMAIYAGGQVLLGHIPGYYVIDWLPVYNFSVGVITFFFTTIILWRNGKYALTAAIATLGVHSLVMIILLTAYRSVVAADSTRAMTIRIVVWIVILGLMIIQSRRNKTGQEPGE